MRIGIAQIRNSFDYSENLESIKNSIDAHRGCDLVVFPECATTGYNTGLLRIHEKSLMNSISRSQDLAKRASLRLVLPTPYPATGGGFFNSTLLIDRDGSILRRFDKIGFQNGEEKLFVRGAAHNRVFQIKGLTVGLVMCHESTFDPNEFVQSADVILWPGFYANRVGETWESSMTADAIRTRQNLRVWDCPTLQVTCATSPEAKHWPDKKFGGSHVFDRTGRCIHVALSETEDNFCVEIQPNRGIELMPKLAENAKHFVNG